MEATTLQKIGNVEHVKCFYDPLRKDDSFIVLLNSNEVKSGFILNDEIILESDHNVKWENVLSILAGFSTLPLFEKIKTAVNEANQ